MDKNGYYYLAPTEIDPIDPADTKSKGFSFKDLEEAINDTPSRHVVTILDCRYSDAAKLRERIIVKGKRSEEVVAETALLT
jgi:hypothetical protein